MEFKIPKQKIDLTDCYVGVDIPAIETAVRKIATEFIEGVLESSMRLDIQQIDETGKFYAVLWVNLYEGYETPVVDIPVDILFDEYLKNKEK